MLRHVDFISDLADGAECVRRLFQWPSPRCDLCLHRSDAIGTSFLFDRNAFRKLTKDFRNHAPPSASELIRCLRIAEGLNTMTRRGEIGTSLPVLGLRPMRWPFLRTTNEPNDDNFTVSPRSRQSVISLRTSSTSVADSVRDSPTFW